MEEQEFFDVVNDKDQVIGRASRDECHKNPKLTHRVIHFTLANAETKEILLTQRSLKKRNDPGKYCFGGEHVKAGETYEQALLRGIQEELGFTPTSWKDLGTEYFAYETQTEFGRFYIVDWHKEELAWNDDDFEKLVWVEPKEESFYEYDIGPITHALVKKIFAQK